MLVGVLFWYDLFKFYYSMNTNIYYYRKVLTLHSKEIFLDQFTYIKFYLEFTYNKKNYVTYLFQVIKSYWCAMLVTCRYNFGMYQHLDFSFLEFIRNMWGNLLNTPTIWYIKHDLIFVSICIVFLFYFISLTVSIVQFLFGI